MFIGENQKNKENFALINLNELPLNIKLFKNIKRTNPNEFGDYLIIME